MRSFFFSLALSVLATPAVAFAAPRTFQGLANVLVNILNQATSVLIVAGIVVYFYGISTNILKFGEGDREKFKNYFFWGIIVLFVMVSIWGILRLLQSSLFGSSSSSYSGTTFALQLPSQFDQSQSIG